MGAYENNRRKQILGRRRRIRAMRHHTVEYIEPNRARYTCTTCGFKEEIDPNPRGKWTEAMARRMIRYWNSNGGIRGECKKCTKEVRDRTYPLTK